MIEAIANQLGYSVSQTREVWSPFSRALDAGVELNRLYTLEPERAEQTMAEFVGAAKEEIEASAGGLIVYRLKGAEPKFASPMEYGGHYLEVDRELLANGLEKSNVALVIEGGPETYLDFVSDLPATVFVWNSLETNMSLEEMEEMRSGKFIDLSQLKQEACIGS
ncbi:MAG: hypothetical protein ABL949_08930 [Fimbriimonadaceae bacterium]